jgi:hypothetical protein
MQAQRTANNENLQPEFDDLTTVFNTAANDLNNTDISSGSNTTFPTNDDIGVTYSALLS